MKKKLILTLSTLLITIVLPAVPVQDGVKPTDDKEKRKVTLFSTPNRKSLMRQRDSLLRANELLRLQIDSLYQINESLAMEDLSDNTVAESINPGFI